MNTNLMYILNLIKSGNDPRQITLNILEQNARTNPMMNNLLTLGKEGKKGELEVIARNMMRERGLDFDTEFNNFKNMIGY